MKYQEYIDLNFKRIDINDNVEFRRNGYYGYCLEKTVNEIISISVYWSELEQPKLYVKKRDNDTYHIITITSEMVKDILAKKEKP